MPLIFQLISKTLTLMEDGQNWMMEYFLKAKRPLLLMTLLLEVSEPFSTELGK